MSETSWAEPGCLSSFLYKNYLRRVVCDYVCVELESNPVFRSHGWRCHGPHLHTLTHTQQQCRKCWSSMTQEWDVAKPCSINPCVCVSVGTGGYRFYYSVFSMALTLSFPSYCCFLLSSFCPALALLILYIPLSVRGDSWPEANFLLAL